MKQLKIKDNSFIKKEYFYEVENIVKSVADKTLEQLDREGIFVFPEMIADVEDMTKTQMILQSVNESFLSGNVMGFIGIGDERLVIESRFSTGGNDFLFQYLLEEVLNFPNIVNMDTDANQEDRLFSLLLFLFPYYLKTSMRKGVFKTYIRNLYNNANDTHKYSAKACIKEINKRIQKDNIKLLFNEKEVQLNMYHFNLFTSYFAIKENERLCFTYQISTQPQYSYSQQAIDFIFDEIKKSPSTILDDLKEKISKK